MEREMGLVLLRRLLWMLKVLRSQGVQLHLAFEWPRFVLGWQLKELAELKRLDAV